MADKAAQFHVSMNIVKGGFAEGATWGLRLDYHSSDENDSYPAQDTQFFLSHNVRSRHTPRNIAMHPAFT